MPALPRFAEIGEFGACVVTHHGDDRASVSVLRDMGFEVGLSLVGWGRRYVQRKTEQDGGSSARRACRRDMAAKPWEWKASLRSVHVACAPSTDHFLPICSDAVTTALSANRRSKRTFLS